MKQVQIRSWTIPGDFLSWGEVYVGTGRTFVATDSQWAGSALMTVYDPVDSVYRLAFHRDLELVIG